MSLEVSIYLRRLKNLSKKWFNPRGFILIKTKNGNNKFDYLKARRLLWH